MSQIVGKELLADMDSYLSEPAEAETALPFETLDDYISDSQEFEDVTAKLLKKVSAVFDLAAKYNRHSPEYLKSCARLEKGIKYLGSACLMKYALVQHKHPQPILPETTPTLRRSIPDGSPAAIRKRHPKQASPGKPSPKKGQPGCSP